MTTLVVRNARAAAPGRTEGRSWTEDLWQAVRRAFRAFRIARQRRTLQQLPDFLLKDIGIERSEIDSIVISIVDEHIDRTRRPRGLYGR